MDNKYYKKVYEVDNNRYYILNTDKETLLGTESFISVPSKYSFQKPKDLIQSYNQIALTVEISSLFNIVHNLQPLAEQSDKDDYIRYNIPTKAQVKKELKQTYLEGLNYLIDSFKALSNNDRFNNLGKENEEELNKEVDRKLAEQIALAKDSSPIDKTIILKEDKKLLPFNHYYSTNNGGLIDHSVYYELDLFGTLTIYQVTLVKGKIKYINTFIYNKELIEELTLALEKEGK